MKSDPGPGVEGRTTQVFSSDSVPTFFLQGDRSHRPDEAPPRLSASPVLGHTDGPSWDLTDKERLPGDGGSKGGTDWDARDRRVLCGAGGGGSRYPEGYPRGWGRPHLSWVTYSPVDHPSPVGSSWTRPVPGPVVTSVYPGLCSTAQLSETDLVGSVGVDERSTVVHRRGPGRVGSGGGGVVGAKGVSRDSARDQ